MKNRSIITGIVAVVGLLAVFMAVLTFKAAPVDPMVKVMVVRDAYLRSSTPSSKSGAGFMELINQTGQDDRLIGVRSDLDGMVQLHSHSEDANGVMTMGEIEGGVVIPAGATHLFARGGDHLMFMGMTAPLDQGQEVPVTLIFETAGEIEVMIPVDSER